MWHADRGQRRKPGPVLLGPAYVLLVETNAFFKFVVIFPDYALRISLGTFSILLMKHFLGEYPYIVLLHLKSKLLVRTLFSGLKKCFTVPLIF